MTITLHELRVARRLALAKVSRKQRATGLHDCLIAGLPYLSAIFDTLPETDSSEIKAIGHRADVMGHSDMSHAEWQHHEQKIRSRYPQLAQALDFFSETLDLIEKRSLWRELGCASYRAYMEWLDVESYLRGAISEAIKRLSQ